MLLKRIERGIYSPNGYNPDNRGRSILAVHPYYELPYDKNILKAELENDREHGLPTNILLLEKYRYLCKLEEVIKNHGGPIINLEEYSKANKTARHYLSLGRTEDTYFIKTVNGGIAPKVLSWEEIVDFLVKFNGNSIGLLGGQLGDDSESPGCLGFTVQKIYEINETLPLENRLQLEILESLTFD